MREFEKIRRQKEEDHKQKVYFTYKINLNHKIFYSRSGNNKRKSKKKDKKAY